MMKPVEIQIKKGERVIVHECVKCGYRKPNKAAENDDFDAILKVMENRQ